MTLITQTLNLKYQYVCLSIVHQSINLYINFYYSRTHEFRFKNDVTHVFSTICFVADSFYLLYLYLFALKGFQHVFNITCYSFSLPVIRKVPLVEKEEPELTPCVVISIRVAKSLPFLCRALITVFTVFRLLTDFVCLYNYEF